MSFSEVREYTPGDDVKFIDWNVTARFSAPFVKVFEEERELILMLMVDISGSGLFGTQKQAKRDLIAEMGAVLAFSATTNNDKVGVIFFSNKIEKYVPPKKGKGHILHIIRELIALEPDPSKPVPVSKSVKSGHEGVTEHTDVGLALEFLNNVMKKRSIAFLLSDFVSNPYEQALQLAARKHDLIGIHIYDKYDKEMPPAGLVQVMDAESGQMFWLDTNDKGVKLQYAKAYDERNKYCIHSFRKSGASLLHVRTDEDYVKVLQSYFKGR